MKNTFLILMFLATISPLKAQEQRANLSNLINGITLGGYAQIDYNEPSGSAPGNLDVHRVVIFLNKRFNDKVNFVTEIEFEHVRKEAGIEQAYISYQIAESTNLLTGLMLIPMGIINDSHEPTTFYGVERPNVDKFIVPTTWREIGIGVSGTITNSSLKYQAYIFNGFKSFANGNGLLNSSGLRNGRQEGKESTINTPNFSTKLDYFGVIGLRLGLAGYFGKTQTDNSQILASQVNIAMIGFDARYTYKNLELKAEYIHTYIKNTEDYNTLTGNDLGSQMFGYYTEMAYNFGLKNGQKITTFLRFEKYNSQSKTAGNLIPDKANDRNEVLFGLNYKIAEGVAFKADYQFMNNALPNSQTQKQLNAGIAISF